MASRFHEIFTRLVNDLFKHNPYPSQDDLGTVFRKARAQAGGEASGAVRRSATDESSSDPLAAEDSSPPGLVRLAQLATASINDLPDSAFAHIEPGGTKDSSGKTTPRSKRHFPIHDAAHVRNALARAPQSPFGDKAIPKILAAAKRYGIKASDKVAAEDDELDIADFESSESETTEALESQELAPAYVSLRLDEGQGIPEWQVYHRIGDHGVHNRYGRILFTQEDGDAIIRNFEANTLGRGVPLDFSHTTALDREAGGWAQEFRWGRPGEGLPGASAPSGSGPILYARFKYNDVGLHNLTNEHYSHQSPEYDRNYEGKHGAVAFALAATNNPFLKNLRTLQGREQMPVMLDDAADEEAPMPEETHESTEQAQQTTQLSGGQQGTVNLESTIRQLQQDLAFERNARTATETRLSAVERIRHEDNVNAAVERAILAGTPPALARKVGRLMLEARPDAEATVRLSNDAGAAPVYFYAALDGLLADLPKLRLGSYTVGLSDERPANEGPDPYQEALDRQLQAAGISTNGNGSHA